ncbi:DNA translocase FtsK [Gordonia desulfuricans]|nr:DNA translocase FtsK [Gordonia desulfuricans]
MSFTVGTNDFRRALRAVAPNACRDEVLPAICRVRCYVDSENVTVSATDRFTAALGLVSVWETSPLTPVVDGVIDLGLPDIAKILAVFTAGKDKADAPEWQLRVELLEKRTIAEGDRPETSSLTVRITDVSGMISGEVLDLPALTPHENFPDLPQLFATHLEKPSGQLDLFGVSGELLARLKTAARVYGDEPLVLSTPGAERAPIIARCGDSFLGLVMPVNLGPAEDSYQADQAAWQRRLPVPSVTKVVELDEIVGRGAENDDEVRRAAAEIVVAVQFGSAAMLQRRLGIGYKKAERILNQLELAGVVGPKQGSRARKVLFSATDVEGALAQLDQHTAGDK